MMQELRLRLRAGADPKRAADVLNESIMTAGNITAYGAGIGSEVTDGLRNAYLNWAHALELQLRALTLDSAVVAALHTERYWRIRTLDDDPRPYQLVDAEVKHQVARLQALLDDLNERLGRLAAAPGHIAVLDTNILLEFLPPDQVPWAEVLGLSPIRLVVPLRGSVPSMAARKPRSASGAQRLNPWESVTTRARTMHGAPLIGPDRGSSQPTPPTSGCTARSVPAGVWWSAGGWARALGASCVVRRTRPKPSGQPSALQSSRASPRLPARSARRRRISGSDRREQVRRAARPPHQSMRAAQRLRQA